MRKKKVISMIVLVAMCFSLFPTAALAETSTQTTSYKIWVGGTQITEQNKDNVLGDNTVSYDPEENILFLNNAKITSSSGYAYASNKIAGIYADGDLNITLTGDSSVAAPTAQLVSSGIRVLGVLVIEGDGSLQASGADITVTSGSAYSYGICIDENFNIYEADVTAIGGNVVAPVRNVTTGSGIAYSTGVYTEGDMDIDFDGHLYAKAGSVKGNTAYSQGVEADGVRVDSENEYLNIAIHNGSLEAVGGDADGEEEALSVAVAAYHSGFYVYENGAQVSLKSGSSTSSAYACSAGVYVDKGDAAIHGGTVEIKTGACADVNVGIFVFGEEDTDEVLSGGTVSIIYEKPYLGGIPSFVSPKVKIETPAHGYAICAENGLDIEECLIIGTPENGTVEERRYYWTIADAAGKDSNTLIIDRLQTCHVALDIADMSYKAGANIPKGKSLNVAYADMLEQYNVDDFSELWKAHTQKDGYIFLGFYTENGEKFDFNTPIDEDITLTAKWRAISYGGGSAANTTTESDSYTKNDAYNDVKVGAWYYNAVKYVQQNGLMNGVTSTEFAPNMPMLRGMLATVLHRMEGYPTVEGGNPFTDVKNNAYYHNAILWAIQNNIVSGVGDNLFAPDANITREQVMIMLYRYAQYKGYDTTQGGMQIREYNDYDKISDYAKSAMTWAVNTNLLKGRDDNTLAPQDNITRAEIAAILQRFVENNK